MNKRDELENQYDLLDQKILRLRTARIIETDAATLFKLDKCAFTPWMTKL
jgi:hypothetical protein